MWHERNNVFAVGGKHHDIVADIVTQYRIQRRSSKRGNGTCHDLTLHAHINRCDNQNEKEIDNGAMRVCRVIGAIDGGENSRPKQTDRKTPKNYRP